MPQKPHILNLAGFSSPQAGQCTTSIAEESTRRARSTPRTPVQRVACALALCALIPLATELDALVTVAVVVALLAALIAYETSHFAELRDRLRHQLAGERQGSSA